MTPRILYRRIGMAVLVLIFQATGLFGQQNDTIRLMQRTEVIDSVIVRVVQPVFDTVYISPFPETMSVSILFGSGFVSQRFLPEPSGEAYQILQNTIAKQMRLRSGVHVTAGYKKAALGTGIEYETMSQQFRFSKTLNFSDTTWYYVYETHTSMQYDTIWSDSLPDYEIIETTIVWTDSVLNSSIENSSTDTVLNHVNRQRLISIPVLFGFTLFETQRFMATIRIGPVFGFIVENNTYSLNNELMPAKLSLSQAMIPFAYFDVGGEYKFAPGFSVACKAFYRFILKNEHTGSEIFMQKSDYYGISFLLYYYF